MPIQQTSLEAYLELKASLGKRQKIVYDVFLRLRKATDREVADYLGKDDPNYVRPRRFELVRAGLLKENPKRTCKVTGKTAIEWRLT
jgi:hypothetical protein